MSEEAKPLTDDELANLERIGTRGEVVSLGPAAALAIVVELRGLRGEAEAMRSAAHRLVNVCAVPDDERDRQIREEAVAILAARKPSDDWLERALDEAEREGLAIRMAEVMAGSIYEAFSKGLGNTGAKLTRRTLLLAILRKHRDGKA